MKDYTKYTVGVLALQGAVSEHIAQIETLGAKAIMVKTLAELQQVDALILPGGESTAIGRLLHSSGLFQALQSFDKPI